MKLLDIKVVPSAGITAYWIAIGFDDVVMVNDEGTTRIQEGRHHILTWWMTGNPGASLAISGTNRQNTNLVEIKKSSIPAHETSGAGAKRFLMA